MVRQVAIAVAICLFVLIGAFAWQACSYFAPSEITVHNRTTKPIVISGFGSFLVDACATRVIHPEDSREAMSDPVIVPPGTVKVPYQIPIAADTRTVATMTITSAGLIERQDPLPPCEGDPPTMPPSEAPSPSASRGS